MAIKIACDRTVLHEISHGIRSPNISYMVLPVLMYQVRYPNFPPNGGNRIDFTVSSPMPMPDPDFGAS